MSDHKLSASFLNRLVKYTVHWDIQINLSYTLDICNHKMNLLNRFNIYFFIWISQYQITC